MKNLIYLLAFAILIIGCTDNSTKNDSVLNSVVENNSNSKEEIRPGVASADSIKCIYCDKNETHTLDAFRAGILIKNFQTNPYFQDLEFCGGTFSLDSKKVKFLKSILRMDITRFHYCYNVENSLPVKKKLFIVFENGECDDNERTPPGVLNKECLIPNKNNYFKKFPIERLKLDNYKFADYLLTVEQSFVVGNESMDSSDVSAAKLKAFEFLKDDYIKCQCEGNFNYISSVKEILDDPKVGEEGGIRYYFGLTNPEDSTNRIRIILVGVDKDGKNLNIWRETSMPHN